MVLCSGDNVATYKLSDISLEYEVIFDEGYATAKGEMYALEMSILYTEVTSIHYQTLSKNDTTWKIDVKNLSSRYKAYCCSLLIKVMTLLTKMKDFTILVLRKS